jgi:hypothetical protein
MQYLRMQLKLSFKGVIIIRVKAGATYDVHNQRSENIAIHDENNFWQSPSEPWWGGQGIAVGLNAFDKRPDPLNLNISMLYRQNKINIAGIIPPCPE